MLIEIGVYRFFFLKGRWSIIIHPRLCSFQSKTIVYYQFVFLAERFRMIWHFRPFWREENEEYYGEIFNVNDGSLIILELGLTEDEILYNMREAIATYDPEQLYTEASDYTLWNIDAIIFL